ncbi:MAG: succinate dehydrogenase assembly factor 4 [Gammaproteobacteria bacterium]
MNDQTPDSAPSPAASPTPATERPETSPQPQEIGGPRGPEPTRFGDWERKGRCIDF